MGPLLPIIITKMGETDRICRSQDYSNEHWNWKIQEMHNLDKYVLSICFSTMSALMRMRKTVKAKGGKAVPSWTNNEKGNTENSTRSKCNSSILNINKYIQMQIYIYKKGKQGRNSTLQLLNSWNSTYKYSKAKMEVAYLGWRKNLFHMSFKEKSNFRWGQKLPVDKREISTCAFCKSDNLVFLTSLSEGMSPPASC